MQYAVNYARVARLHFLARSTAETEPEETTPTMSLSQQIRFSSENPTQTLDHVPGDETLAGKVLNVMTYVAPIKKLSREEAYERLLKEKERLDRRLQQIEAEENRIFEAVQARAREKEMEGVEV